LSRQLILIIVIETPNKNIKKTTSSSWRRRKWSGSLMKVSSISAICVTFTKLMIRSTLVVTMYIFQILFIYKNIEFNVKSS
jgi:hypothetical protein